MNKRAQPETPNGKAAPRNRSEASAGLQARPSPNEAMAFAADSSVGARPSVELHIDELVLEGFDPAHRDRISVAVERELTELFAKRGTRPVIDREIEAAHADGCVFEMETNSPADEIGKRVAKAIYGGLDNE